jgi:hypothetical protein
MEENHIILGLDSSEAVGRDFMGLIGINILDGSVAFTAPINETNLIFFCKALAKLLTTYKNITLVIEKKSTGQMIIDYLLIELPKAGEDPFKRIYNRVVQNSDSRESDFQHIQKPLNQRTVEFYTPYKMDFGFVTTGNSRDLLYSRVLTNAAKTSGHLVKDDTLAKEIGGLVTKNGRIDHSASGHDDCVMAWLFANWFLTFGLNTAYYGIKPNTILSQAGGLHKSLSKADLEEKRKQQKLRVEIEDCIRILNDTTDTFKIAMMEQRVRMLNKQLASKGVSTVNNLDDLLKEAKEHRTMRRFKKNTTARQATSKPLVPSWW